MSWATPTAGNKNKSKKDKKKGNGADKETDLAQSFGNFSTAAVPGSPPRPEDKVPIEHEELQHELETEVGTQAAVYGSQGLSEDIDDPENVWTKQVITTFRLLALLPAVARKAPPLKLYSP
jgi:hypothetical protein